jgi:hypothetical protein
MKNSGEGGPVGTFSPTASDAGCAGCTSGCISVFDLPTGNSATLVVKYLTGFFHGEICELGNAGSLGAAGHVEGA